MGKKGDRGAHTRASAFLLKPSLIPKVFDTFAERYANRPGGYTRIHKFGNRPGDNAPRAVLELVDNPRDLRTEMTSRAIGWEMLKEKLKAQQPVSIINNGAEGVKELIDHERDIKLGQPGGILRPKTRWNLQKILRFRDDSAATDIGRKVEEHVVIALLCISSADD
jgi:large subunit ribosomal protein L17